MNERNTKGIQKLVGQFHLSHVHGSRATFEKYTLALSYSNAHRVYPNKPRSYLRWNWNSKQKLLARDVDFVLLQGNASPGVERYFWIDRAGIAELKKLLRNEKPGSLHVSIQAVDEGKNRKSRFLGRHEKKLAELHAWFDNQRVKEKHPGVL